MVFNCDKFYEVVKDDECYQIAMSHGITPDQFKEYNPAVKTALGSGLITIFALGLLETD